MAQSYRRANIFVPLINYHFRWTPRRRVLAGEVKRCLSALLLETKKNGLCDPGSGGILDHVHLLLNYPPVLAPKQLMFLIEGDSAPCCVRNFIAVHQAHAGVRLAFPGCIRLPAM